ncbi:SMI1/KNR4 family protein [Streptomyces krungchingensis]|uniref:SMI1/KNR4 family protein n=1 Tax=Streptomyces krungchingensis TaxID=1565034 RepID=UPI003CF4C1EC
MSIPSIEDSWARIDAWLAAHAPVSHARLRPPASQADIEAAQRTLDVAFHPDLKASLRCHDGVEPVDGTPVLAYYGPLSSVTDIVRSTEFLRGIGADLDEDLAEDEPLDEDDEDYDELASYWHKDWLLITLGIGLQSSDGLFLTCHAGAHWGRVGRYFDEDAPSFTSWPSLRHVLAEYADALERGSTFGGRTPVVADGTLLWDDETSVVPQPRSPLALAAAAGEPRPAPPAPAAPPAEPPQADGPRLVFVRVRQSEPPAPPPYQPDTIFVEGIGADQLLERLGAVPGTVLARTREHAEESAESLWAAHRPLVRAGTAGAWAYAVQEAGAAQFGRPEVLRRVSARTRAVALTKRGPEVTVTLAEDGVARPKALHHVLSPREDRVDIPGTDQPARRVGTDPFPGSQAAYVRVLAALEGEFGIVRRPADDVAAELTSALLLPVLDDMPETGSPVTFVRDFDLAALVGRTPADRLRAAFAAQLARLAAETHIDTYPEVADALELIGRGERVPLTADDALDLRLRTLAAEAWAARQSVRPSWRDDGSPLSQDDTNAWWIRHGAAGALRAFILRPVPEAAASIIHQRTTAHWRAELAEDLASS